MEKLKQQINNNTDQIKEFEKHFETIQTNFNFLEDQRELTENSILQLSRNLEVLFQKLKDIIEQQKDNLDIINENNDKEDNENET